MVQLSPYTTDTEPMIYSLRAATTSTCLPRGQIVQQEKSSNAKSSVTKTHPTRDKLEQQQVSAQSKINKYHVKKILLLQQQQQQFQGQMASKTLLSNI